MLQCLNVHRSSYSPFTIWANLYAETANDFSPSLTAMFLTSSFTTWAARGPSLRSAFSFFSASSSPCASPATLSEGCVSRWSECPVQSIELGVTHLPIRCVRDEACDSIACSLSLGEGTVGVSYSNRPSHEGLPEVDPLDLAVDSERNAFGHDGRCVINADIVKWRLYKRRDNNFYSYFFKFFGYTT